jgi:hypothetical protein
VARPQRDTPHVCHVYEVFVLKLETILKICMFIVVEKMNLLLMYVELVQLMRYRKIQNNINKLFMLKYIKLDTNHV